MAKRKTKAERDAEIKLRFRAEPAFFAKAIHGITLDEYAKEALDYLAANPTGKTIARLPRGAGKTYGIGAVAVSWFMACFAPCRVVTTAPTFYQVENLLWRDITDITQKAKQKGVRIDMPQRTRWELPGNRFASGISTDVPARIEGPHADNVLVILDEAKGVAKWAWDSLEGSFSTCRRANELAISTPWDKTSELYRADSGHRGNWKTVHREAKDCPRIKREWIEGRLDEWGEDNPLYQAQVLAKYVELADNALVPLDWLERARYREPMAEDGDAVIGLDIQRGGPDANVLTLRRGGRVVEMIESRSKDTTRLTNQTAAICRKEDVAGGMIDSTGVGGPIADRLRELGFDVQDFDAGAKPYDEERFFNVRAEAYWNVREWFREGRLDLSGISDAQYRALVSQLTTLEYTYDESGKLRIERKEHWRSRMAKQSPERTAHSPDHADSLAMCLYCDAEASAPDFTKAAYDMLEAVPR